LAPKFLALRVVVALMACKVLAENALIDNIKFNYNYLTSVCPSIAIPTAGLSPQCKMQHLTCLHCC
jgi:hypothetical protein